MSKNAVARTLFYAQADYHVTPGLDKFYPGLDKISLGLDKF